MKNLTTVSRLACLTIVLAASTMMLTANIANAKGDRHQDNKAQNNGARPHGVMSGKPVVVKKVLHDRKDCRKKDCERAAQTKTNTKPVQPTAQGGAHVPQFVVSGQPVDVKRVVVAPTATISNGVTTSAISNGKGLIVTAASPTSIMVTNSGHSSVTLGGQSVTLHDAASIQIGPGMEARRLPNGDVTIAMKPAVAGAPTRPTPPGVGPGDDVKAVATTLGTGANVVAASPVILGTAVGLTAAGAVAATIAGEPVKGTKQIAGEVANSAGAAIEWVAGWF
jgi:hypothetical protein